MCVWQKKKGSHLVPAIVTWVCVQAIVLVSRLVSPALPVSDYFNWQIKWKCQILEQCKVFRRFDGG